MRKVSYGELKYEDYADIRLHLLLRKVGQELFYQVLKLAFPIEGKESYYDRLESMNVNMKKFDFSQRHKLRQDKTGSSFDITLIYKLLLCGLPKIAPPSSTDWADSNKLEYYLKQVKDIRNDLMHAGVLMTSVDLKEKFDLLCNIFVQISDHTCDRFGLGDKKKVKRRNQVKTDTKYIFSSKLTGVDLDDYLINHGIEEAKSRYRKLSCVNPVDFFVGINFTSKIDDIFVTLDMKELDGNEKEGKRTSFYHLFKVFYEEDHSVIVVEGVAGSGKTTLIKYFLSTWINEDPSVEYLKDFSFVIFFQCNNTFIKSINDLMRSVMPETSRAFKGEDLIETLFCRKLLFIVDGIDEANSGTRSVLLELFHKAQGTNVKFFCTSRPEKIEWLHRMTGDLSCCTFSIIGVSSQNRESFVEKLYNCCKNILGDKVVCSFPDVLRILDDFPAAIKAELKLPLFLSLFTYLCAVEPEKVQTLRSVASLYNQLVLALKEKLYSRALTKNSSCCSDKEDDEIKEDIESCYQIFCQQSFISLTEHGGTLTEESTKIIKNKSSSLGLNPKEVLSAFLVVKIILTPRGITENVGFPHKGLQDFLAAMFVATKMYNGESLATILNIKQKVDEVSETSLSASTGDLSLCWKKNSKSSTSSDFLSPNVSSSSKLSHSTASLKLSPKMPLASKFGLNLNTDFMRFQNLIVLLAGILGMEEKLDDNTVNEIIRMYRKSGVYHFHQWLCLLTNLRYHNLACEHILTQFKKMIVDDHNLEPVLAMLKYSCPQELILTIWEDKTDKKEIRSMLQKLAGYQCNIKILFKYQLLKPCRQDESQWLKIITQPNSRCILTWYEGCLRPIEMTMLPPSVQCLYLGVGTKNHCQALKILPEKSGLSFLRLHVERNANTTNIEPLKSLPKLVNYYLYISGLDAQYKDIKWAVRVAVALNPTKVYGKIMFPKSNLNEEMTIKLLTLLKQNGIKVSDKENRGICVVTSHIDRIALASVISHCYKTFGCKFLLQNEEEIWW